MPLTITHSQAADGTFSTDGATYWNADHTVTGALGVANGGTGLTTGTSGGVLYYSATGTLASSGVLTSGRVVLGGGAGAAPNDSANLTFATLNSRFTVGSTVDGTSRGWIIGSDSAVSQSKMWSSVVSPSATNYAIATDNNYVWLNAATGASVDSRINNVIVASVTGNGYALGSSAILMVGITAPTLASGGCTGAAMVNNNGTARFQADVGTSCSGSQPLVFTLPAAANSWACSARNITNAAISVPVSSAAVSTTSITITNYSRTTGLAAAWTDGDDIEVTCMGG